MTTKRTMVQPDHQELTISAQCELLELPRASYYRSPAPESDENLSLMHLIDELYTRHPSMGSRQIRDRLRLRGHAVNRKRVQRLMNVMGIASLAPQKKKTTVPAPGHKIYPYLLRNLLVNQPDQVWASDFTYIRLKRGFVFLTAVMDWHSRYVLSWEISVTMDEGFCVSALERALRRHGAPEVSNTDQGSQYTGATYTGVLKEHGVKISMDGKGRATDNIMIERLWRTVKYDDIYLKDYETVEQLIAGLRIFFDDYNNERPHSSHGGKTPAQIYFGTAAYRQAA